MSTLDPFKATRSLAKIRLENNLRLVNDFYWGIYASTRFAAAPDYLPDLRAFVGSTLAVYRQGRLLPSNLPQLVTNAESELPKLCLILLFSYFEPYLRDVCMCAALSNPSVVREDVSPIDGESIAGNDQLLSILETLYADVVERWLKGSYADRFGCLRRAFGLPRDVTDRYVRTIDEYYAKRNCLVHMEGRIDVRAKRYFEADTRNVVGGTVIFEPFEFVALHRAVHDVCDLIDRYMIENHIKNAEVLRVLWRLRREHSDWTAKQISREMYQLRLGMVSRNRIASMFRIREE